MVLLLIMLLSFFVLVTAQLDVEILDIPKSQDDISNQCTVLIQEQTTKTKTQFEELKVELKNQNIFFEEQLKEKTNPLFLNLPVIILIILICLFYLLLKAGGKV